MIWVRKFTVLLLSLVLLVCLVGEAFSVSTNINLAQPQKLESWLKQSDFYDNLVTNQLNDAQKSAGNDTGAGRVSLNDPIVQKAVKSVLTPQLLQQYAATFLNSNYAWLQGKTARPQFRIDLTAAKEQIAQKVGSSVETRVAGLQACSAAQLSQLQATLDTDPFTMPCRLPSLTPQAAGKQAEDQISSSRDFLNHPVITADQLNPNGSNNGQPYYQKFSRLPKSYRLNRKLPWIFGAVAIISAVGVLFVSLTRRRGLRRIGWVLTVAGIILVVVKFASDSAFNRLDKKLFNNSNLSQIQQSLTDFLHHAETQLVKTDLWFGIAFLVLAAFILGSLWFTRHGDNGKPSAKSPPSRDETPGDHGTATRPELPVLKQTPRPPKRPRLIQ